MNGRSLFLWMLALALAPTASRAAEPGPVVDFARDIYPILQRSCFECHGPEKQQGKLRLDSRAAALRGGKIGPALVPGQAKRSELYRRITRTKDDDGVMPIQLTPDTALTHGDDNRRLHAGDS